ncbi:hypothetical protein [Gallibacterium anatis]|uniref:hypothetical protein n=1 Tax=Gallibacterium anatis TaxID=750 RepID=UPI00068D4581|nr:hypothetical protein [Gallibacterium anatis]
MPKAIFEIFRTGKHNGVNSRRLWKPEELKQIATSYHKNAKSAPLVIGHPSDNLPQFGEVNRLIYCKEALFAEAEISEALIDKINRNEISGISASFYLNESKDNPISGAGFYLNHVGFLENGKQKPAVKNMLPPEISVQSLYFSEEADVVFFCENETLDYTERLHEKISYLEQVLNVDYSTAFHLAITPEEQQ